MRRSDPQFGVPVDVVEHTAEGVGSSFGEKVVWEAELNFAVSIETGGLIRREYRARSGCVMLVRPRLLSSRGGLRPRGRARGTVFR
jgi:hypothetical protein